jgi:TRAP-type C4-dicarboxylate transport system permease small subunit
MWLGKAADTIYRFISPVSKVLVGIGSAALAAMMFLTAADVTLRYVFNKPIMGAFDLTVYMMVILFAFALPYCAVKKGHISVDLLIGRLPQKVQTIINTITAPLGLGLFVLIAWQAIVYMLIQKETNIASTVLNIPRYPFVGLLFIGVACLSVVLLADFLKTLSEVSKK